MPQGRKMIYFIIGLVIYAIIGLIWFITGLGRKMGPAKWYDNILGPGMYLWFPLIWLVRVMYDMRNKKWKS